MRIPGIRRIEYAPCSLLQPHIAVRAAAGEPVAPLVRFTAVAFDGVPELTVERARDDGGGILETSTLTFRSPERLPAGVPLAFAVTDMHGVRLLIGAREAPHPKIETETATGTPDGDAATTEYTVTHTDLRSAIPDRP